MSQRQKRKRARSNDDINNFHFRARPESAGPAVFKYSEICSSLNNTYRFNELQEIAKNMGVVKPETLTKNQICKALTPIATDMMNKRPYCTNVSGKKTNGLDGHNLLGDEWKDIPPYLIYTFRIDQLDDENGIRVRNATVCADLRDLINYLDTTERIQDPNDDDYILDGSYDNRKLPELFSHQKIKLPHSVRQDIRKRWELLTDFGKNPIPMGEEIIPIIPSVKQRVTDLYDQMRGYPAISIDDFSKIDPSILIGYLESASRYPLMHIEVEDIDDFKREPSVTKFIDLILRKADQSESRNTFMVALTGIINGDDLGDIQIPSSPDSISSSDFNSEDEPRIVRQRCEHYIHQLENLRVNLELNLSADEEEEESNTILYNTFIYNVNEITDEFIVNLDDDEFAIGMAQTILSDLMEETNYKFIRFILEHRVPFRDEMIFLRYMLGSYNLIFVQPLAMAPLEGEIRGVLKAVWDLDTSIASRRYVINTIVPALRGLWSHPMVLDRYVVEADYQFILRNFAGAETNRSNVYAKYIENIRSHLRTGVCAVVLNAIAEMQ